MAKWPPWCSQSGLANDALDQYYDVWRKKDLNKLVTLTYHWGSAVDGRLENNYNKTPLLRSPLDLRKNGVYSGVVLLLS